MAKKRMQMAQKSWKLQEIFPRFVNARMAKGVSDKTVLTYNRHVRSPGYPLDMTMTFWQAGGKNGCAAGCGAQRVAFPFGEGGSLKG